jgi:hypothetical protein
MHISTLELLPRREGSPRLDFVLDGVSLLERFQAIDFVAAEDRTSPSADEEWGKTVRKHIYASRLGSGSPGWQLRALDQLLRRAPPELPDGRRRLYVCGGDCECAHVACFIENREGLFIWKDFQRGSPPHSGAESFQGGRWKWVDFGSGPGPTGFDLTGGPFYFDETEYRRLFQPLCDKLANPISNK